MGGGGSSERLASAQPTSAPYYVETNYNLIRQGFVDYYEYNNYNSNYNKNNIAILILILIILLFHLYIISKIKKY
jgi:hypothetical protein